LLACARRHFDAGAQAGIETLLHRGIDWPLLLASARQHRLLPLLYHRLRQLDAGSVPEEVMAHLRTAYYTNLLRNEWLRAQLQEIVAALRQDGVDSLVLKGGALAWTIYPSPAQRPMADLDLMVRPEHGERAAAVLGSLGFRLSPLIPAHLIPFQRRFGVKLDWLRFQEGVTTLLDLQYNVVKVDWCRASFPVEGDALWQAARPLALDIFI
jgi:hypothetical protein